MDDLLMETFVVRVWVPADDDPGEAASPLTGVVEHIRTGRSEPFHGDRQLAELIAAALAPSDDVSPSTGKERR